MNDFDPSLDELVSAYVDGVATPDERARVESDPALVERAATFRRLQEALAKPSPPADDELRRALIARALAETAVSGATVHTLRSRRSATLGPIAAAAAVIAMFFGIGTWLVASQDNADETTRSAASSAADALDLKDQGNMAATTAGASAPAGSGLSLQAGEAAKTVPTHLGAFADETALRQALLRARDGSLGSAPTTVPARATTDNASCPRADPADASIYSAELRGRPVTIVVSGTRADVLDNTTCVGPTLDLTNR